jgi:hypothetical protein
MKFQIKNLPEKEQIEIRAFLSSLLSFIHKYGVRNNLQTAKQAIEKYFQIKPKRKTELILNYLPFLLRKVHRKVARINKNLNNLYND